MNDDKETQATKHIFADTGQVFADTGQARVSMGVEKLLKHERLSQALTRQQLAIQSLETLRCDIGRIPEQSKDKEEIREAASFSLLEVLDSAPGVIDNNTDAINEAIGNIRELIFGD